MRCPGRTTCHVSPGHPGQPVGTLFLEGHTFTEKETVMTGQRKSSEKELATGKQEFLTTASIVGIIEDSSFPYMLVYSTALAILSLGAVYLASSLTLT